MGAKAEANSFRISGMRKAIELQEHINRKGAQIIYCIVFPTQTRIQTRAMYRNNRDDRERIVKKISNSLGRLSFILDHWSKAINAMILKYRVFLRIRNEWG